MHLEKTDTNALANTNALHNLGEGGDDLPIAITALTAITVLTLAHALQCASS